jgi:copper chaperone
MKNLKFKIQGMHCNSCAMLIKDALEDLEGVKNAEVSNEKAAAYITFDENKQSKDNLAKTIENEGYVVK